MILDKNYYPGFTRKAITFTIDDGNVALDKKFIDIVRPAGIFGTFNLSSVDLNKYSKEYYLELYSGFGIANHCMLHPYAMEPGVEYNFSDAPFDPDTADEALLYKTKWEGVYHIHFPRGWRRICSPEKYLSLVDDAKENIESVFGRGTVRSFVWPFCEQKDPSIKEGIIARSYRSIRAVGERKDTEKYSLPKDRLRWSFNANHSSLLSEGEKYEAYPDDGELKFFAFGVHSHDFENNNCWNVLEAFAEKFGNRREDFYYASVDDIFDYEDALNSLEISESRIYNPSLIPLYMRLNGEYIILPPKTEVKA